MTAFSSEQKTSRQENLSTVDGMMLGMDLLVLAREMAMNLSNSDISASKASGTGHSISHHNPIKPQLDGEQQDAGLGVGAAAPGIHSDGYTTMIDLRGQRSDAQLSAAEDTFLPAGSGIASWSTPAAMAALLKAVSQLPATWSLRPEPIGPDSLVLETGERATASGRGASGLSYGGGRVIRNLSQSFDDLLADREGHAATHQKMDDGGGRLTSVHAPSISRVQVALNMFADAAAITKSTFVSASDDRSYESDMANRDPSSGPAPTSAPTSLDVSVSQDAIRSASSSQPATAPLGQVAAPLLTSTACIDPSDHGTTGPTQTTTAPLSSQMIRSEIVIGAAANGNTSIATSSPYNNLLSTDGLSDDVTIRNGAIVQPRKAMLPKSGAGSPSAPAVAAYDTALLMDSRQDPAHRSPIRADLKFATQAIVTYSTPPDVIYSPGLTSFLTGQAAGLANLLSLWDQIGGHVSDNAHSYPAPAALNQNTCMSQPAGNETWSLMHADLHPPSLLDVGHFLSRMTHRGERWPYDDGSTASFGRQLAVTMNFGFSRTSRAVVSGSCGMQDAGAEELEDTAASC